MQDTPLIKEQTKTPQKNFRNVFCYNFAKYLQPHTRLLTLFSLANYFIPNIFCRN